MSSLFAASAKSLIPAPETPSTIYLRAQRDVDCRCDVHQKCRFIGQGVRESNSFSSLERAYAFPRGRVAVARLLLDFGKARPASVTVCAVELSAACIQQPTDALAMNPASVYGVTSQ
jgi:hypothetical protein